MSVLRTNGPLVYFYLCSRFIVHPRNALGKTSTGLFCYTPCAFYVAVTSVVVLFIYYISYHKCVLLASCSMCVLAYLCKFG